jgi:hypothetical protein
MAKVSDLGPPSIHVLLADSAYRESFWSFFKTAFGANDAAIGAGKLRSQ